MSFLASSIVFAGSAVVFLGAAFFMAVKEGLNFITVANILGNLLYVAAYLLYVQAEYNQTSNRPDIPIISAPPRRNIIMR
jgi:hypothetical protein